MATRTAATKHRPPEEVLRPKYVARRRSAFDAAFAVGAGGGPAGEGEAVDFGVVADVHGEVVVEIETGDRCRVGLRGGELAEFAGKGFLSGDGKLCGGLDDEGG